MGRRRRQRERAGGQDGVGDAGSFTAPTSDYADAEGNVLTLRGSLPPAARIEYAGVLRGGLHREDSRQRALELLFERLAVAWTVSGVRTERQRDLLARLRAADPAERSFVRESLRAHVTENFPDLEAP